MEMVLKPGTRGDGQTSRPATAHGGPIVRSVMPSGQARPTMQPFDLDGRSIEYEVLAAASGSFSSWGPMTRERRQYICRRGSTYFVIDVHDEEDPVVHRIGYRKSPAIGFATAVQRSTAFVLSTQGEAVPIWIDEDEGLELDDESWDPSNDDDCDDDGDVQETPLAQLALWDTVITDDRSGVVLAGPEASQALPAGNPCFVIVGTPDNRRQLYRVGISTSAVTVTYARQTLAAFMVDVPGAIAVRLGLAFSDGTAWQLTRDAIRAVDCTTRTVVATALRDHPLST
jgi:hypothetical protein